MTRKRPKAPTCQHCHDVEAVLVPGSTIYPRRGDLAALWFWYCGDCGAYCGCHKGTKKALGRPANAELRNARTQLHQKRLDPIWRDAAGSYDVHHQDRIARKIITNAARSRTYAFLAEKLGITVKDCHVAMFSLEQCRAAWTALFKVDYSQIRAWHKAKEAATPVGRLKAAGKTCANCVHRLKNPGGLTGLYCDLDSDSKGYAATKPDASCVRHTSAGDAEARALDKTNEEAARYAP